MSLPSFQASEATWMFHVTKAHLTDKNKRTACGRTLETVDSPSESWDGKSHKCKTCEIWERFEYLRKKPVKELTKDEYDFMSKRYSGMEQTRPSFDENGNQIHEEVGSGSK